MLKVGINAYGTIGKRVAEAITKQNDMQVTGVIKAHPNYMSYVASKRFKLFVPDNSALKAFENSGIKVEGTLENLMDDSELIIDSTPEGMGEEYKKIYEKKRIKAIFQGGEDHELTNLSFNAYANFKEAWGKDFVRVVSCNTTGLIRTLFPLTEYGSIKVRANLVRRATDPDDYQKGPINSIVPELKIPSHHGPDVASVIKGLDIQTMAVKVPTTLMHLHFVNVTFPREVKTEEIIEKWKKYRRIAFVSGKDGVKSTSQLMDIARETGRERSDLYEIMLWKDSVSVKGNELFYYQAVHQESDVVPENIDAIRSMFQLKEKQDSIDRTDKTLRIGELAYGR
ncbi:MAG: type II glyceraldehyde-3-phosphate dehydrogenase [Candidatus Thermoplasmatota archaeon]|nr:type II glyceraldehyde-3-phosphate dehydrogenase [Candidatus Thermoplasmatota archaeon]